MVDSQPPADYLKKVGEPSALSDDELAEFAHLVSTGGKVSMVGLPGRLRNAHLLATLSGAKGSLLATAGLKRPEPAYRERVSTKSGIELPSETYPLELG